MPHSFFHKVAPSGHVWSLSGVRRGGGGAAHLEHVLQSLVRFTTVTQSRCCNANPFKVHLQTAVFRWEAEDGCLLCVAEVVHGVSGVLVAASLLFEGLTVVFQRPV